MRNFLLIMAGFMLFAACDNQKSTSDNTEMTENTPEESEWMQLYKPQDFENYVQINGQAKYEVTGDTVIGYAVLDEPNSFLCTPREYGDFVLEYEVLVDTLMNSGVQIRSHSIPEYKDGRLHGYQVEIDPSDRAYSGGIYDEARRGWLYDLSENEEAREAFNNLEWNKFRVMAKGDSIKTWVNGVMAANLMDTVDASGLICLQVHSIHGENAEYVKEGGEIKVMWRNVKIKEL